MKTDRPSFGEVARAIGDADWEPTLKHFSPSVRPPTKAEEDQFQRGVKRVLEAAGTLTTWLPIWAEVGMDEARAVLEALPKIVGYLSAMERGNGRPVSLQRELCAAIIVEIWKLVHGEARYRSQKLYEVCNDYWLACGGQDIGDIDNWRRPVERVAHGGVWSVRQELLAVRNRG